MRKYLTMLGNVLLYLIIMLASMVVVIKLVENYAYSSTSIADPKVWVINNLNLAMVGVSIISLLLYTVIFKIKKKSVIKCCDFSPIDHKAVGALLIIAIAMSIFSSAFIRLSFINKNVATLENTFNTFMGASGFFITIISSVIIVPVFEELLFRGLIFNEMKKVTPLWIAIIVQSFLYAVVQINIPTAIFGFIGGILYALVYLWLKSIWAPIILQVVSCFIMLMFNRVLSMKWLFGNGDISIYALIAISLIMIIVTSINIRKTYRIRTMKCKEIQI